MFGGLSKHLRMSLESCYPFTERTLASLPPFRFSISEMLAHAAGLVDAVTAELFHAGAEGVA